MNENKFTGKAELYSKYRPSYSEKLIDWLYEMTNAETVADIGAGTGIFTSALLKKPWSVTAGSYRFCCVLLQGRFDILNSTRLQGVRRELIFVGTPP